MGQHTAVLAAYRENIERKPAVVTLFVQKQLEVKRNYLLDVVKNLAHDLAGNLVSDTSAVIHFSSEKIRDTFPAPRFTAFDFSDSSRGIAQAFDMVLHFTDAVDTISVQKGLHLVDSAIKEQALVMKWTDGTKLQIRSKDKL